MSPFGTLFVPEQLSEAVSDDAWVAAMLDAERALAAAGSLAGVVPAAVAAEIAVACDGAAFDAAALAESGRAAGTPVEPLVRALRASVGDDAERYVHFGATSQDIMDSAAMLVARRTLDLVDAEMGRVADACARHAQAHRSTPMVGRTLLQQAVPTTFGLKAAGWLVAMAEARSTLAALREGGLAAQLGGAAGTLSVLGPDGILVAELFAEQLGLAAPPLPWHTNRVRIAELGAALGIAAGTAAKIGLDIMLLAQTEVGEVAEAAGRSGTSSTMPQKRNPVGSMRARACARIAAGHASVLTGALEQEHERAAGAWQAEWEALSGALVFAGGAAAAIADALEGLEVDAARMRANLDLTGGLVCSERVSHLLAERLGHAAAHDLVADATRRVVDGMSFRAALLGDARVGLTTAELDAALDPATYLGAAEALVDRALERHAREAPAA
jgi:3-carboxy-cis,cis-muconate cycloisomerase